MLRELDLPEHLAPALRTLAELLREVAVPRGFVATSDADRVLERHVADSLRASAVMTPEDRLVADVGSGAGLPGLPLAIARPTTTYVLIEAKRARSAFIELAVDRLGLRNVDLRLSPVEAITELGSFDVVLTRAFAPLERAWEVAAPLLRRGGRMVFFAGAGAPVPGPMRGAASARVEAVRLPMLERTGPLIIITR